MLRLVHSSSRHVVGGALNDESVRVHLDSLKHHHIETYRHSVRVGLLSTDIGWGLELASHELRILCWAALLHDIGKTRIPSEILSKPSGLCDSEKEAMNHHPRLGFLELGAPQFDMTRRVVVSHHEYKKDPYPRRARDRRLAKRSSDERRSTSRLIEMFAQIVAAADIFDALAYRRSYKPPLSRDQIKQTMNNLYTGPAVWMEKILARP